MTRQEIQKQKDEALSKVAECDRQLAELPVYDENWKPERGDEYFVINDSGICPITYRQNNEFDTYRINAGNCYPTREQAERHAPVIAAFRKLLKAADASGESYYIDIFLLGTQDVEATMKYQGTRD